MNDGLYPHSDDKHGDVQKGFQQSLDELNVEYIDLWLMHWPMAKNPETSKHYSASEGPTFVETWRQMEKMLESGKVKAIGVSNFSRKNLEVLLKEAKVVPAVNQVECHPYLPQNGLAEYCASKGIVLTAYCRASPCQLRKRGTLTFTSGSTWYDGLAHA